MLAGTIGNSPPTGDDECERDELARDHDGGANRAHTLAVSGSIIGFPASSAVRIPSRFTGARRKTSSPSAAEIAFSTAQQPAATGGSPMPRAPTGVSGSGSSTAAHSMCVGASRMVGGLL